MDPFVAEIRIFPFNFAPKGWAFCDGQILPLSQNTALFSLLGTTYGGDGQSTFALPDLRGRLPLHMGNGFTLAETGGSEEITLTVSQIPGHSHPFLGSSSTGTATGPASNVLGESTTVSMYDDAAPTVAMAAGTTLSVGGSQPHNNFQPYLCVDFIISLFGIFPSQT